MSTETPTVVVPQAQPVEAAPVVHHEPGRQRVSRNADGYVHPAEHRKATTELQRTLDAANARLAELEGNEGKLRSNHAMDRQLIKAGILDDGVMRLIRREYNEGTADLGDKRPEFNAWLDNAKKDSALIRPFFATLAEQQKTSTAAQEAATTLETVRTMVLEGEDPSAIVESLRGVFGAEGQPAPAPVSVDPSLQALAKLLAQAQGGNGGPVDTNGGTKPVTPRSGKVWSQAEIDALRARQGGRLTAAQSKVIMASLG